MVHLNEIILLKEILFGKSIIALSKIIGLNYSGSLNKNNLIDENNWAEIEKVVLDTYAKNIHNPIYSKLRKRIELKNAKSGFIVPQNKLIAKEKLPIEKRLNKTDSNSKVKKPKYLKSREASKTKITEAHYKRNIYLYFQHINYDEELHKIYKSEGRFKQIKTYLKSLFENQNDITYNKLSIANNFKTLYKTFPYDKEKSKEIIKLFEFEKRTNAKRNLENNKSIRAISIPMGGQN